MNKHDPEHDPEENMPTFVGVIVWLFVALLIVMAGFLAVMILTAAPAWAASPSPLVVYVTTGYSDGRVNVRECPSLTCPVIGAMPEGAEVYPAPLPGSSWALALTPFGEGWIYGMYLSSWSEKE